MKSQRTFSHLNKSRRIPTTYEIATSNLHYYIDKGFEVDVSIKDWYSRYQEQSPFTCQCFSDFTDPRATTYSKYVEIQKEKEAFVDHILELIELNNYDNSLSLEWLHILDNIFPQLRFLYHGFQMVGAYIAHMAPGSQITIAAALQAADEMRKIQRIAYRTRQLRNVSSNFGIKSKEKWERDELWQPLRKLVETLLVTYDWGEAFIALNLSIKPIVDRLFFQTFSEFAKSHGDYQLSNILLSLNEDSEWHLEWSQSLVELVIQDTPKTKETVDLWIHNWKPLAESACMELKKIIEGRPTFNQKGRNANV